MSGTEFSPGQAPMLSRRSWLAASAGCLTAVGFATHQTSAFADEGWEKTQQQVSGLVAACQFEKALQLVSAHIKANPGFAPAYEQRAWVMLDWLDLRDEVALTDLPLRHRYVSDPATGLSNIDPPVEVRRQYVQDLFFEKYAPPAELKTVERDLAEYRRLSGDPADGQAIEAFLAEFIGDLNRTKELISARCADGTATPREYLIQCRISRNERDLAGALAAADRALRSPETLNQASKQKYSLLRALNRTKQASEFFDEWQASSPRDARLLLARSLNSADQLAQIQDLERLISMMP
ncbi:MAG TPA: hypothetical protein VGM98_00910, partial [Schlesneria sp.]